MADRSYDQYCSIAYALDIIGERWTLLIVRELMLGPRRFKDLQEGLPGIGTNLLSDRLKKMMRYEIIQKRDLLPPAASTVYELTENGQGLKPVIESLARWGYRFLGIPEENEIFNPRWLLLSLETKFQPQLTQNVDKVIQFNIDDEILYAHIKDGTIETKQGNHPEADLTITSDSNSFITFVSDPDQNESNLNISLEGDRKLFDKISEWFDI